MNCIGVAEGAAVLWRALLMTITKLWVPSRPFQFISEDMLVADLQISLRTHSTVLECDRQLRS